ncbi:MAG TPA: class I tRNA ligase family protein, partial [Candidatus Paceibacterota bacterium]|nr:class I tRNA ligase family protein [Candidatus Paceibacterota bacterium]
TFMAKNRYDHTEIERKAQEKWAALNLYETDLADTSKDPYYLLFEFPYPSGDLHIGHWYAFGLTDIYARLVRMQGKNVLFPVGFDAFGLPAENAAIKNGADPRAWTYANMERMRSQMKTMGTSVDWSKEVVTCSPEYYKWTQWLFAKLYEHKLAERREASVKWCPHDQTVLANEQVIDGKCERCGHDVEEKRLTQWFLKITEYAERLLTDLEPLPWREDIKDAQRAWIGKSEGAKLYFDLDFKLDPRANERRDSEGNPARIAVFTTRPDTIFGATYLVLAPEHPWMTLALKRDDAISNTDEVRAYVEQTARKTERERSENKEKTGVKLEGVSAINPATKEEVPIFVADYVLGSYGTGAVMAVPAHDERDFEFAQKHGLPIRHVIDPVTGEAQENPKDKDKIVAVVEHAGKVLTINWPKELGGRLLVGGTAEESEDAAVTAAREIAEETGYVDLELIERAPEQVHHSYFAFSKNQATTAHTTLLHFRLKSEKQDETKLEADEIGKFTVEWVSPEQAVREIHDDQHQYALARFTNYGPYTGDGLLRDSGAFGGRPNREVMQEIVEAIGGEITTNYRLRDWLVSRQRYWGCPIPVVYDPEGNPHLVPPEHLPWLLPEDVDFTPGAAGAGNSPLATSKELKQRVENIFGEGWTPEYDTLDTFVDSSWYYLRYLDPKDTNEFSDQTLMKAWLPVNRYSGGSEHTTMHLLYSRFFHKALFDMALVPTSEPFFERYNRGLVMGPDGHKMSKSKGNVINPDQVVSEYGADTIRMYLAFLGPYNEPGSYPWKPEGVQSMRRFLDRIVTLSGRLSDEEPSEAVRRALAKAARKVGTDTERFKLNTAISGLMVLVNELEALSAVPKAAYQQLLILLAPYAPHLAEYLHEALGGEGSVHQLPWPAADESLLTEETITLGVQIAGKRRGEVVLAPDASEEEALAAALSQPDVSKYLEGGKPSRVIYVPGRILNLIP